MLDTVAQLVVSGLLMGLVYALIAVCIGIIYNATQIVNFSQGEFVMLGGVIGWAMSALHAPLWVAIICAIVMGIAVGVVIERVIINVARRFKPPMFTYIFLLFGVSIVLSNGCMLIFGKNPLTLTPFLGWEPVHLGSISIASQYAVVVPCCLILVFFIRWFFDKTRIGKGMKAAAVSERGALLVGINTRFLSLLAFGLCGGVSALVGIVTTPITTTYYAIGMSYTMKAFAAAIGGGLGNLGGAMIGGILVGLVESLGAGLVSSQLKNAFTFSFLIVVLVVLPRGILRSLVEERERV